MGSLKKEKAEEAYKTEEGGKGRECHSDKERWGEMRVSARGGCLVCAGSTVVYCSKLPSAGPALRARGRGCGGTAELMERLLPHRLAQYVAVRAGRQTRAQTNDPISQF